MTKHPQSILLPAVLLLVLMPLFIGLGVWQLHRAEGKRALQDEYDKRASEAPTQLGPEPQDAQALRFRRVTVRGKYEPEYQILIDNRVHQGAAGYHVVTPLKIEGGSTRVLVNRGWVPIGESRQKLPSVDAPEGVQQVSGVVAVPAENVFSLDSPGQPTAGWQPVWLRLDMKRYINSVPFTVQPIVILLDPTAAGGYVREWARLDAGIAVHEGYAFQWFALATLDAVILAVMIYRARRQRRKRKA